MTYPVLTVPPRAYREDEYLGTKYKFWFFDPSERWVLFKRGRKNEDWSEKVAAELARRLEIPAAHVDLAECDGERGIVSPTLLQPDEQMHHGNELLVEIDPDYPQGDRYRVAQHTLDAVFAALERNGTRAFPQSPPPWPEYGAQDQFVGYLLLDALIGNTDRHHENWAVLQRGTLRYLAPTYDHASSLGRNETEVRIEARLQKKDPRMTVASYVAKGTSAFYRDDHDAKPMRPLEAFLWAKQRCPRAAAHWTTGLEALTRADFEAMVAEVPEDRMSNGHRRFAVALLVENQRRVLNSAGREPSHDA